MADNVTITAGTGTTVSTEEVTTLNGAAVSAQHLQRTATAIVLSDGTAIDLPGDVTYGLDVDVTRISGTAAVSATNLDIRDLSYTSDSVTVYGTAIVTATNLDVRDLTYVSDSVAIYGTATVTATDLDIRNLSDSQDSILVSGTVVSTATNLDIRDLTSASDSVAVVQATAASLNAAVIGAVASDGALGTAYPVISGMRASTAEPTAVSADGDAVALWGSRRGTLRTGQIRHSTLNADPYTLTAKSAQYTAAVTGTAFWTPTSGNKIVLTSFQIQTTGTTGGSVQLWFGASADTTYTRGTDLAVFDGDFIPSATSYPGVYVSGVWMSSTVDHVLRVTSSAAINTLTVTVWGYEFTP